MDRGRTARASLRRRSARGALGRREVCDGNVVRPLGGRVSSPVVCGADSDCAGPDGAAGHRGSGGVGGQLRREVEPFFGDLVMGASRGSDRGAAYPSRRRRPVVAFRRGSGMIGLAGVVYTHEVASRNPRDLSSWLPLGTIDIKVVAGRLRALSRLRSPDREGPMTHGFRCGKTRASSRYTPALDPSGSARAAPGWREASHCDRKAAKCSHEDHQAVRPHAHARSARKSQAGALGGAAL